MRFKLLLNSAYYICHWLLCVTWIGLELLIVLLDQSRLLSVLCKFKTIVLDLAWLIFDWLTGLKYSYLIVAEYFFLLLLVVW